MDCAEGYAPRCWSSERIKVKDFLTLYSSKVVKPNSEVPNPESLSNDNRETCRKLVDCGLTQEKFDYLESYCSIDQVNKHASSYALADVKLLKEKPQMFKCKEVDPDTNLKSHDTLKARMAKKDCKFKYTGYVWMNYSKPTVNTLEPLKEVVITVRVFHPFLHQRGAKDRTTPRLRQQLLVLGCQPLSKLRDAISCISDGPLMKETSENPAQKSMEHGRDKYKSGFFFIEGTFYNDHRDSMNIDYSETIRTWASSRNMEFDTKKMEETKFRDLSIQLGHPYVYQHQGNCEHLIIFSDIRLLNRSDVLTEVSYPIVDVMKRVKTQMCIVCGVFPANWLTRNNERVFTHTAYFCDTCFKSFNYVDGKKIGNFLAYPIYQT